MSPNLERARVAAANPPLRTENNFMLRVWIDETFEVQAGRDEVFTRLSDVKRWPSWVPGIASIWGGQAPSPGRTFFMVLGFPVLQRVILPCTIKSWNREELEWGGGGLGSIVRHRLELTPIGPSRTRIRHVEYATGLLGLFFRPFEKFAYNHDHTWNEAMKKLFAARPN